METFSEKQIMEMFTKIINYPREYRIVCELNRTHTTHFFNEEQVWHDYYMFDLSANGDLPIFDKVLITLDDCQHHRPCMFVSLYNAFGFLKSLVKHNKVKDIYIDCF